MIEEQTKAMARNAVVFDEFCKDVEEIGGKVFVGLSSNDVPQEGRPLGPAKDIVIRVLVQRGAGRDPVYLTERVTGPIAATTALLRTQLGMV